MSLLFPMAINSFIKLFFLEPMVKNSAMFIEYEFELETKELKKFVQSFGRIFSK